MAQVDKLPPETEAAATQEGALPLLELTLLGTLTSPEGAQAILRSGGGKIYRLSTGDQIEGAAVTGIGDGTITLTRRSRAEQLSIPGS